MTDTSTLDPVGIRLDLDENIYHAHPTSLSVTGAKTLLRAPALYKYQREHAVHKDVFDFGKLVHAVVLGAGADYTVVQAVDKAGVASNASDYKTKAAQAHRDEIRAGGGTPVLMSDVFKAQRMAAAVHEHGLARAILSGGEPEVSAFCPDPATGMLRRSRFDYFQTGGLIVDYKTSTTAEPNLFLKNATSYGYHMQAAWYLDIATDLGEGPTGFLFIAQEKTAPYLVSVIELPENLVEAGRVRNHRALELYRRCVETGVWGGYVPDDVVARPEAAPWMLKNDEYAAADVSV